MTESSMDVKYQINHKKLVFVGDAGVGKTSIILSIKEQDFNPLLESSIAVDFFQKEIIYKEEKYILNIWDTAGQEKYRSLIPNYLHGANFIFLVFDVTKEDSFNHLEQWKKYILNIVEAIIIIVGNKIDLKDNRKISKEDAENFCTKNNLKYFEVSAKERTNIKDLILLSINNNKSPIIENKEEMHEDSKKINIKEENNSKTENISIAGHLYNNYNKNFESTSSYSINRNSKTTLNNEVIIRKKCPC